MGDFHLTPGVDSMEHEMSRDCFCRPMVEEGVPNLIWHHKVVPDEYVEGFRRPDTHPQEGTRDG